MTETPFPLGRIKHHDERSRLLEYRAPQAPLRTVYHRRWSRTLDQLDLGSCVGHAIAHALNSTPLHRAGRKLLTHNDAVDIYSRATELDIWEGSWPPIDSGTSANAGCKAARERGLIRAWSNAFGLQQTLGALVVSPLLLGVGWREDMFWPSPSGMLTVSGPVVGGHEVALTGIEVQHKRVRVQNSWGPSWGIAGVGWLTWDDLGVLLDDDGDVVAPVL